MVIIPSLIPAQGGLVTAVVELNGGPWVTTGLGVITPPHPFGLEKEMEYVLGASPVKTGLLTCTTLPGFNVYVYGPPVVGGVTVIMPLLTEEQVVPVVVAVEVNGGPLVTHTFATVPEHPCAVVKLMV